ncbi:MAG: ADOP family duplicated permease [Vicinamibacteraceae bacterium]
MSRGSAAFDKGAPLRRLRALMLRARNLFAGRRLDADLAAELESHLQLHVDDNIRAGMTPEEARRRAILTLGGVEQTKERHRDRRGFTVIDELARDVRYAGRRLRKDLGFTLVAVVSLALGIGANAAIYSLFYQVLLRPLPVPDPDRLVNLSASRPNPGPKSCGYAGGCDVIFSYPMFRDLERVARGAERGGGRTGVEDSFTGIAAHRGFGANLAYRGETMSGSGALVSGSYFPVLGLRPALGRLLEPGDDRTRGESPVVVLSYAYWQSSFGARPTVLNDTMVVNGHTMTIVGVAPRGFEGTTLGEQPQVFVPITMRWFMDPVGADREPDHENRRHYWIYLFARLRAGVSLEQAHTAINGPYHSIINEVEAPLQSAMSDQGMTQFRAKGIRVDPGARGQSDVRAEAQVPLMLLLGFTTLVLLIACVNITNLLLARAAARSREMALRVSIGASRRRLISQLLTESSVLALVGGVASLLVARWTMSLLRSLLTRDAATLPLQLDASAIIVTAPLALGSGLLVGLVPALHAARSDVVGPLKGQAGQPSGGRGAARFRVSLATAQIALSTVLLVLAGLFTKSLVNVSRVDLGLTIDHLLTFRISPERNGYTAQRSAVLFERLEEALHSLPGVTAVASSRVPLLVGGAREDDVVVEGLEVGPDADDMSLYDEIGPGYFRALGIPLIAGREFTHADSLNAAKVAIVNEQFADKFDLGRDAVGKRMGTANETLDVEIMGLVRDARLYNVKNAIPPTFFLPHRQNAELGEMTFHVRSAQDPGQLGATVRQAMSRLDPNLPVEGLRTVPQQLREESMELERLMGVLTAAFAGLATLLAAIGLYGVLAYTVAQRTREIGLRMALGATRGRVRRMVLHQVGLMTLVGGTIGVVSALAVGRTAQALLFELDGHDPMVLTAAAVALTLVALGAGWIPAHRASRTDPMRALKYE